MFYKHATPRAPITVMQACLVIGGGFLLGLAVLASH